MSEENLTPWQKYQKGLFKIGPWASLSPETKTVSYEIQENRYSTCQTCPEFIKITRQCKKTGSFMDVKIKIEDSKCPLGKW